MLTNTRRSKRWRQVTALVAVTTMLVPARDTVLAQAASGSVPPDGGWPRAYMSAAQAQLVIYQPQVASWDARQRMVAYAAVLYQAPGGAKPAMSTVKIEANTVVALEERLVRFAPLRITETNFTTLSRDQVRDLLETIENGIPEGEQVIALDRVLGNVDKSQIIPRHVDGVKADPPTIFHSERPAVLVSFDGSPVWSPIEQNDLQFAVNTNWDVFQYGPSQSYYLRNDRTWLKGSDLRGPWGPAGQLPDSFAKLPDDDNWKDVKASLPGLAADPKTRPQVAEGCGQ